MIKRRLRRIFRPDGRTLVVACDHGMISGPDRGIERLGDTLQRVIAGGDTLSAGLRRSTIAATISGRSSASGSVR